jgi:glycosyltransferase involved in cell wall biosynthesis
MDEIEVGQSELVSVYLPTRNRRDLLERAISSVLRQSYKNIELIVSNDCSTDGTRDYLDCVASRESRLIPLHSEEPSGAPAARNRAIQKSKGRFITGLDDDDEFRIDRIELFVSEWKAQEGSPNSAACLFSESVMTDGATCEVTTDRRSRVVYHDLFEHNFIGNQVFCPRQHLIDIGGFDEKMRAWQDLETFMRLLMRYGEARLVPQATYIYHIERDRDRISTKPHLLRSAFKMIKDKHVDVPDELHQLLFLQMFSPFYRVKPTLADWKNLMEWRAHPRIIARMLRATARNNLRF